MAVSRICSVDGCGKKLEGRGYCKNHYHRFMKYGDALAGGTPHGEPQRYFIEVVLKYDGEVCLTWPYAKDSYGYGQLSRNGAVHYVTRLVCEAVHGDPPSPKHQAAHSCGRGHEGCCAPSHLRWATVAENHADKKEHGTDRPPPVNAKLSPSEVKEIRRLKGQLSQRKIAARFGVKHAIIGAIHRGTAWRDL